jgi:SAM-dependent methyltransferase
MTVFNEYARYYDMFYQDKDYRGEADYVHKLIQELAPGAGTVLNLGCGSGRHDRILAELCYKVTGVDLSREMLVAAEAAGAGNSSIDYVQGDARSVRLKRTFDVVIALFHVMSYQVTNADLKAVFETARCHLKPGGVFIFDCWYGPGVLCDLPTVRVREIEDTAANVIRIAEPVLHANDNVVDVNYRVIVMDKSSGTARHLKETHRMRYLFIPELKEYLDQVGFNPEFFCKWLDSSPPNETTWYLCCGARYAP